MHCCAQYIGHLLSPTMLDCIRQDYIKCNSSNVTLLGYAGQPSRSSATACHLVKTAQFLSQMASACGCWLQVCRSLPLSPAPPSSLLSCRQWCLLPRRPRHYRRHPAWTRWRWGTSASASWRSSSSSRRRSRPRQCKQQARLCPPLRERAPKRRSAQPQPRRSGCILLLMVACPLRLAAHISLAWAATPVLCTDFRSVPSR